MICSRLGALPSKSVGPDGDQGGNIVTFRRVVPWLLASAMGVLLAGPAHAQSAPPNEIVISEFRTRGPAGGNDEFVELRNRSSQPVDISGWQLQGCAAASPGNRSTRTTVAAEVRLAPGGSYLFGNDATGGYSGIVAPDQTYGTGFTDFSATNFSGIRIVDAGGTVRDGVGSPSSPCREGIGLLTPSNPPSPNADYSFERLGGTTDTNNNLPDFQGPKPGNPQNSGGNTTGLPPVAGLRIHDIQGRQHLSPYRGFSVLAVPGVVTARRANGFYYQDPQPDMDLRTSEGIFVFTRVVPPASVVVGAPVSVSGRVSEFRGGCSPSCTPPNFDASPPEFGSSAFGNLTTTQIESPVVTAGLEPGPIAPTVVGVGGREPPIIVIDDDTPDPPTDDPPLVSGNVESKSSLPGVTDPQDPTFDPNEDGLDFHESLEGMLVQVNSAVAVSPTVDFSVNASRPRGLNSEIAVLADNGANAQLRTLRGGIIVRAFDLVLPHEYRLGDFNPERLILNDPIMREQRHTAPLVNVHDTFTGPVRAVVDYSFGNFKYLMLNVPSAESGGLTPEVTTAPHGGRLSVATYNVENLDPVNDAARLPLIARQIIDNLRSPDLIALVEMQDFDGEGPGGPAGEATFAALSAAIAAAGGPAYEWRQIDPAYNADGGVPNGNIRVGFMFRTDRGLSFVDRPGGTAATPTEDDPALPGAQLTFSPGRIDPSNPVWTDSRKPLAGEFRWHGKQLFVVANHFASKNGDAPVMGRFQEPMRPTEIQRRGQTLPVEDPQRGQAGVVNAWVRRLMNADPRANIVVLGDLNDFHFSETNRVLEQGRRRDAGIELVNLWRTLRQADRYSYIFQGNSQDLDHILVSPNLLFLFRPELDAVHINSEFWSQISDHDPLVALLGRR